MALPRKLKNMNLFNDGISYAGQIEEVTPPNLSRIMEDWRGGGMNAPIKADQGMEALSMEWTCGGFMQEPLHQFGITTHDGVLLRFAGAYQADDTGSVDAVEITVRGRHSTIEQGNAKPGEASPFKVTTECSYYKLTINGEEVIEIDIINMIEKVNGVDRLADQRKAIGL
ncbi:phage major tail tube protein [Marinobacterium sedimentorum]|uniref:phage major tail tube protein n=1 Tax=Marinobacterium sedimentorum TaxID=2927804 RepID=UPI0020C6D2F1|nr:phage major tail tube protein [Marinobacterium sedimentorum]MCP8687743.1 phage major tail tube protein [Marinobacterium sedimentorum]